MLDTNLFLLIKGERGLYSLSREAEMGEDPVEPVHGTAQASLYIFSLQDQSWDPSFQAREEQRVLTFLGSLVLHAAVFKEEA